MLREVLKHPCVEEAVQCEIDGTVRTWMSRHTAAAVGVIKTESPIARLARLARRQSTTLG